MVVDRIGQAAFHEPFPALAVAIGGGAVRLFPPALDQRMAFMPFDAPRRLGTRTLCAERTGATSGRARRIVPRGPVGLVLPAGERLARRAPVGVRGGVLGEVRFCEDSGAPAGVFLRGQQIAQVGV